MTTPYLNKLYHPVYKSGMPLWSARHMSAVVSPKLLAEVPLVDLMKGWLGYADAYQKLCGAGIWTDLKQGACWNGVGILLRLMLEGETGRLDREILDTLLADTLSDHGFNPDGEMWPLGETA